MTAFSSADLRVGSIRLQRCTSSMAPIRPGPVYDWNDVQAHDQEFSACSLATQYGEDSM